MMTGEGVKYHSGLTSEVESFLKDVKSGFEQKMGELDSIKNEIETVLSSISHVMELSSGLDGVPDDPSLAVGTATDALGNYNDLYSNVHASVAEIRKSKSGVQGSGDFLTHIWNRYRDMLHRLVLNAISYIRKYSQELGIKNFSITISSMPPSISATLYFQ